MRQYRNELVEDSDGLFVLPLPDKAGGLTGQLVLQRLNHARTPYTQPYPKLSYGTPR